MAFADYLPQDVHLRLLIPRDMDDSKLYPRNGREEKEEEEDNYGHTRDDHPGDDDDKFRRVKDHHHDDNDGHSKDDHPGDGGDKIGLDRGQNPYDDDNDVCSKDDHPEDDKECDVADADPYGNNKADDRTRDDCPYSDKDHDDDDRIREVHPNDDDVDCTTKEDHPGDNDGNLEESAPCADAEDPKGSDHDPDISEGYESVADMVCRVISSLYKKKVNQRLIQKTNPLDLYLGMIPLPRIDTEESSSSEVCILSFFRLRMFRYLLTKAFTYSMFLNMLLSTQSGNQEII